ncbi:MAG: MFS transporter [Thermoleophilaceae bacterium]|jgi:MFS family permease
MPTGSSRALTRLPLAGVAFLALADTAIVALALPPILSELDTDVAGVAAVLGVYAVVLAAALLPAERLGRVYGIRALGLTGIGLFSAGSLACGLAGGIELLLIARAVQALGGAALLVTAHAALVGDRRSATGQSLALWRQAALLGTAAGPVIGGALTQAFGWRSIFLIQVPAALAAVPGCLVAPRAVPRRTARPAMLLRLAALGLVSGAIAAALFLTVLLLISGWSIEPLVAALVVSVMPVSALAAARIGGPAGTRAVAGALLVAAGAAALAFLPTASVAWMILPEVALGIGMGLALTSLSGELLPDRDGHESARLLTTRHLGIALALLILAPIAQRELDTTLHDTRLQGVALILDARIDPRLKLDLAPQLNGSVETQDPRGGLDHVFADARDKVDSDQIASYDDLTERADDLLVTAVNDAFRTAFLVAAGLALLAAALLAIAVPVAAADRVVGFVALGSVAGVLVFGLLAQSVRPEPVVIADPCENRQLPSSGGLQGLAQDAVLRAADAVACRVGSSREELVLALADDQSAREYERRYGVNPRSAIDVARQLLPG